MTVKELKELLSEYDDSTKVVITYYDDYIKLRRDLEPKNKVVKDEHYNTIFIEGKE